MPTLRFGVTLMGKRHPVFNRGLVVPQLERSDAIVEILGECRRASQREQNDNEGFETFHGGNLSSIRE